MTISEINAICANRFGSGVLAIDPLAALWLAEFILANRGLNVFKTISNRRHKFGKGTTFPEFGTPLFASL